VQETLNVIDWCKPNVTAILLANDLTGITAPCAGRDMGQFGRGAGER
jgi:hypothetical protein